MPSKFSLCVLTMKKKLFSEHENSNSSNHALYFHRVAAYACHFLNYLPCTAYHPNLCAYSTGTARPKVAATNGVWHDTDSPFCCAGIALVTLHASKYIATPIGQDKH